MFTQFLQEFRSIFPSKSQPNINLQRRISRLFTPKITANYCSPTLTELQAHKNKVRRLSSVYEQNIAEYNEANGLRSSFIEKKSFTEKLSTIADKKLNQENIIPRVVTPEGRRIDSIQILISLDADYIESMKELVIHYIKKFENLPALRLRNETYVTDLQKREIFGPIEDILKIHEKKFYPMLTACAENIVWFAKNVSKMCKNGRFNCYIVYAMDEKVSLS